MSGKMCAATGGDSGIDNDDDNKILYLPENEKWEWDNWQVHAIKK